MNGNIFNYSLALEQYEWCGLLRCYGAYAIPPAPPANVSTATGEPIFAQSYIDAYNTAFNQFLRYGYNIRHPIGNYYPIQIHKTRSSSRSYRNK